MADQIAERCSRQCGVLTTDYAAQWVGAAGLRWRIDSGRWQRACHGVVVTHSGPLSRDQQIWVALLGCGTGAVLAGLTAAGLDGLTGFDDGRISRSGCRIARGSDAAGW